jgi:hypothetical protein
MQLRDRRFVYQLVDQTFFDTLDRYAPNKAHYINFVNALLPAGWRNGHKGVWAFCYPPDDALPTQGWKIHLSATLYNARAVLAAAVPVLVDAQVAFKFGADRRMYALMSGKNWTRGGSGKFMTVYPRDEAEFRTVIQRLHAATVGLSGPYILSDKRYDERGIVYYRYGTMRPVETIDRNGHRVTHLIGPDGEQQVDDRQPVFSVPSWATDPFPREQTDAGESNTLKNGRYRIDGVLTFSNTGGVYLATDRDTGMEVVIKEARPFVAGFTAETDAVALLQKEYRVMKALEDTGYAPKAYDLFRDWEHWFLVEEKIVGVTLFKLTSQELVLLKPRADAADYRRYHELFRDVFRPLALAIAAFHERGIALCDLSPSNVVVSMETKQVTLIDFEAACQAGIDIELDLMTPGFAPRRLGEPPSADRIADDYFALAAMMLAFAFPVGPFLQLLPADARSVIDEVLADAALPDELAAAIRVGVTADAADRPTPQRLIEIMDRAVWTTPAAGETAGTTPIDLGAIAGRAAELRAFIVAQAHAARPDALFPGDFRLFETNPLSLAYGAYGTFFALSRTGGAIAPEQLAWARKHIVTNAVYPPGFLTGQAGIAWASLELGETERARDLLEGSRRHPLLRDSYSLYDGRAGWILSAMRMGLESGDERWLDAALAELDEVLAHAAVDQQGRLSWAHTDDQTHLGLGYGASGIALVLLYASIVSGERRYLDFGLRALEFDLAHGQVVDGGRGGRSWAYVAGDTTMRLPYAMYGSAGIGSVLLRYRHLAGITDFDAVLEDIYIDTDRKYSLGLGRFMGLAGIANFRLDAYQLSGEQRHRDAVAKQLRGIELFRLERPDGLAYPGELLDRISCDYGYGCAGLLTLFGRLLDGSGDELMLDRQIAARTREPVGIR